MITNPLIPISVYNHIPGLINLYSTKSGALLAKIQPDAAILAHIKIPAAVAAALNAANQPPTWLLGINYTHILWSADGQQLALTFSLYNVTDLSHGNAPDHLPPGIAYDGLLLMQRDGTQPQVFLHQTDPRHPAAIIWNVSTGQALSATVESSGATTFTSLAPALSYQWNADGTLSLQTPLTSTIPPSPTAGAIGALDGGASFSIWQSGFVFDSLQGRPSGQRDLSNVPSYSTDLASWSPDGRYLAERIDITGLLQMAGQAMSSSNAQTLASYGWGQAPVLPIRDAGLQQGIAVANKSGFQTLYPVTVSVTAALVAWRPDGRLIAVNSATPNHAVILYDCATGKQVAALQPNLRVGVASAQQNEANLLRWSPDGKQLALYDTTGGLLTIWSGASLPH